MYLESGGCSACVKLCYNALQHRRLSFPTCIKMYTGFIGHDLCSENPWGSLLEVL